MSAKFYAMQKHKDVNHLYDNRPYEVHLAHVVKVAESFIHLIPSEYQEAVLNACWCHDLIEDTRETYNDIKKACGSLVAEIVFAVTNEKGRNRKERANEKYYLGIANTEFATFVKLCDRIANIEYSKINGNVDILKMYRSENKDFVKYLADKKYMDMLDYLLSL